MLSLVLIKSFNVSQRALLIVDSIYEDNKELNKLRIVPEGPPPKSSLEIWTLDLQFA